MIGAGRRHAQGDERAHGPPGRSLSALPACGRAQPAHQRDELVFEIRNHPQEALRQIPAGDKEALLNVLGRVAERTSGSMFNLALLSVIPPR
jgi:hypothetical protein